MPKKNNKLKAVVVQCSSSDEDHASLSDIKKLINNKFEEVMSAIQEVKSEVEEVKVRLTNLEGGMERLSIATKSNVIETKAHSTGPRCLKLVFRNKVSLPVLNGEEIKGEGGKCIEIALIDEVSGNVIDFGQEASAHVRIVALEGGSDHCERDTWVIGNYKKKSVSASVSVSEEKRSVLVGQVNVKLNKGIGSLANVKFRNSSNHNSGVFKLGAKVIGSFDGTLIKETTTESFVVKDFREKYKQKHYPPSLSDAIWRLENIQKSGSIYQRVKEKVKNVEDFLIQHLKDPEGLKCLLHLPEKKWKATVNHAKTCTTDQRVYCSIKKGVVFNVVGKPLGLIKDWNYVRHDMLSEEDKVEARKLITIAFKEKVKIFDNEETLLQYLSCQSTNSSSPENTVNHQVEISNIGESDQSNLDASSRDARTSKHPNRGIVSEEDEANDLDRVNLENVFPSANHRACGGPEAPLHDPIHVDQANVDNINLIASSQELLGSKQPGGGSALQEDEAFAPDGLDFQAIFPSIGPTGSIGLEGPLYSPYNDRPKSFDASLEDALLSWSPGKAEVSNEAEATEFHGFDLQDMEMMSNACFLNPHEKYPPMGPLWRESIDQYNIPSSSSLIDDDSYWCTRFLAGQSDSSSNMWYESGFIHCLGQAANRSWKILLWVIKWCLKVKKAASKRNRLKKKQRIS